MVFDGHGLPHIQAFRTYTDLLKADRGQFDGLLSSVAESYEQIEGDDWIKRIRKDRIAKRETQVVLSTGSHDGLEVRVIECAYRDGVDKIGRTTPFYIRNAVTEYQIAFGELFWRQRNEHLVVRAATKALVKPEIIKKHDDLQFKYHLENRHLDTPRIGILRRHRKPEDSDVRLNCCRGACYQLENNICTALRPLFGRDLRLGEWRLRSNSDHNDLVQGDVQVGDLIRHKGEYHGSYPFYILQIPGQHIRDDDHAAKIRKALEKKRIIP